MNNLTDRLKSKADMISLGERIVWGSDTGLMLEAAERIAELEREHNFSHEIAGCTSDNPISRIQHNNAIRLEAADRIAALEAELAEAAKALEIIQTIAATPPVYRSTLSVASQALGAISAGGGE